MKRVLAMFLVLTMVLMCFSGCDVHDSKSQHREDDVVEEPKTPTTNTTANGPTMTDEYAAVLDRAVMLLAGCGTCFVNGRMVTIEGAIPAKIDGVMYIPAVFVAERLGGLAERTDNGFALTINGQTITLEITGEDTVKLNGNKIGGYDADSDVIVEAKPLTDAMKTDVIASGDLLVLGDGLNENAASINPDAQTLLLDSIATQLQTKDVITTVSGTSVEAPTDQFDGAYGQIRRWSFDDSDIPIKSKENELAAVLGPLCVENVKITDLASEDGAHRCSFTVYNCLGYTYGAVEVYDGNGEWQETVVIEPYEGQKASIVKAIADVGTLLGNTIQAISNKDIDYLTYKTTLNSSITNVSVVIPRGGYLLLSCNMTHSSYVAAYNAAYVVSNLIMTTTAFDDLLPNPSLKKEIGEELTGQFYEAILSSPAVTEKVALAFRRTFASDVGGAWDFEAEASELLQVLANTFGENGIDIEAIVVGVVTSLAAVTETVVCVALSNAIPVASSVLTVWGLIADYSNAVCLYYDLFATMATDSLVIEVVGWREAYARFLLEHQEAAAGLMFYEKGQGRFYLADIDHCGIPELFVFSAENASMGAGKGLIYRYSDGEVKQLVFYDRSTDVTYIDEDDFHWSNSAEFPTLIRGWIAQSKRQLEVYYPSCRTQGAYTLNYTLGWHMYSELYWFNQYNAYYIERWDYDYCKNYKNKYITKSYFQYVKYAYEIDVSEYSSLNKYSFYRITPQVIQDILGYPEQ